MSCWGLNSNYFYSYFVITKITLRFFLLLPMARICPTLEYIHNNLVKDKTVSLPEDYYFSSARNYAGLEVILLDLF